MKVTSVRVLTTDEGNLRAYADITIDNCFRVRDLKSFRRPARVLRRYASGIRQF
jgi:DNA-binding cell septation regulator SpoVG